MSLLTAAEQVARETGILSTPATVIGNTDTAVVQLLALFKRSALEIALSRDWQKLIREHTITTTASDADYALPSDWARYVSETAWDATNYWPMRGSLDPQYWQALKRGIVTLSIRKRFCLFGNMVNIVPTPTVSSETLIIEYLRNTPWTDSAGTTWRTAPTADTDLFALPQHLLELDTVWRLRKAKGLDYGDDFQIAQDAISLAFAQDSPAMIVNYGIPSEATPPFYPVVPQQVS